MMPQSNIGVNAIISILKIDEDGVNNLNSEVDEKQFIEKTVVVPDPIAFNGVNASLIVVGKFIL